MMFSILGEESAKERSVYISSLEIISALPEADTEELSKVKANSSTLNLRKVVSAVMLAFNEHEVLSIENSASCKRTCGISKSVFNSVPLSELAAISLVENLPTLYNVLGWAL